MINFKRSFLEKFGGRVKFLLGTLSRKKETSTVFCFNRMNTSGIPLPTALNVHRGGERPRGIVSERNSEIETKEQRRKGCAEFVAGADGNIHALEQHYHYMHTGEALSFLSFYEWLLLIAVENKDRIQKKNNDQFQKIILGEIWGEGNIPAWDLSRTKETSMGFFFLIV
jgi:hypothetical protein